MVERTPLVLVPGVLCTRALWEDQLKGLADVAHMTVADHTRHDTMTGIAESILASAPPRFALAGLSMGGYISHEIFRLAPERIIKLALLDTGARADTPERSSQRRELMAKARREGSRAAQQQLLPVLIHKDRLQDQALVEAVLRMGEDTGVQGFINQQTALIGRPDSRPQLPHIKCPTLVLVGRQDALTPLELSQEMANAIPNAKLEIIAGCGHLSTMERPDAVNRAMRDWLAA
jgi:pimeloyl-ACP methyl ester carboxylesterase